MSGFQNGFDTREKKKHG